MEIYPNDPSDSGPIMLHRGIAGVRCREGYVSIGGPFAVCLHGELHPQLECVVSRSYVIPNRRHLEVIFLLLPRSYDYQIQRRQTKNFLQILGHRKRTQNGMVLRPHIYNKFPDVAMCETLTDYGQERLIVDLGDGHEFRLGQNKLVRLNHGQWIISTCMDGTLAENHTELDCWDGHIKMPACYGTCRVRLDRSLHGNVHGKPYSHHATPHYEVLILKHKQTINFTCGGEIYNDFTMIGPAQSQCNDGEITVPTCHGKCQVSPDRHRREFYVMGDTYQYHISKRRSYFFLKHGQELQVICKDEAYTLDTDRAVCNDGNINVPLCYMDCKTKQANYLVSRIQSTYKILPWTWVEKGIVKNGVSLEIECTNENWTYVNGNRKVKCNNGDWEGVFGVCIP